MKKVLIVLMVFGFLVSCKSKENSKENKTENKTKDDYQSVVDKVDKADNDEKTETDYKEKTNANADELDEDGNSKADVESINGQDDSEWPQSERDAFMTNCVREAVKAGRSTSVSQRYCDCMLGKIEGMYPNINDAATLTNADIKRITDKYAPGCLK
mgnify:FL=1